MGTSMKANQPPPPAAVTELKVFTTISKQFPMKQQNWKWVIVVDDDDDDDKWNSLMNLLPGTGVAGTGNWNTDADEIITGMDGADGAFLYAHTELNKGVTYLRGTALLRGDKGDTSPEFIVVSEMARIYLHSTNDVLVTKTTRQWLMDAKNNMLASNTVTENR
jgi:hypothetical protein